jgi:anaerobic magnesium-protoporphyrin IX monomethyl ester cyclase
MLTSHSRVVLISPPFVKDYMRNARCDFVSLSRSSWFPIWLGQAGAYLDGLGHKTWLYDAQVLGHSFQNALDATLEFKPDLVVVYTGRLSEDNDALFADRLAERGVRTVFVGPYASIEPKKLLEKCKFTTLAIQKEFELPLRDLLEGKDPSSIENFIVKDSSTLEIRENSVRPFYKTEILDTFPLTSEYFHRQLDIRKYKTPSEYYPFIDIMSGRGCAWGKCNFCLWVQTFVTGTTYNMRSIEHFLKEFDYISRFMPEVKSVMIQDDMLTNKRALEISEGLLARGNKLRWSCYAKPNSKLTIETMKKMRKSGCLNLHVGFESGDDAVLEKIDKGSSVEQAKELGRLARESGLFLHADFAMGHFGDTRETMRKTIELAKEIDPHTAQFQLMIPFERTKFMSQLTEKGCLTDTSEPTYQAIGGASVEEIRSMAKKAYREFYLSPRYLGKALSDPTNYLFNRFDQFWPALQAIFWKRWVK